MSSHQKNKTVLKQHSELKRESIFKSPISNDPSFKNKLENIIDKDQYELLLGEPLEDLLVPDQIVRQPYHMLVAGQVRSGKTSTVLNLITQAATIYPKADFLFADGKASPDYDLYADRLSRLPVAKVSEKDDRLVELEFMIDYMMEEYNKRISLINNLQSKGKAVSTYTQYNSYMEDDEKIEMLYVVIDEFDSFASLASGFIDKLVNINGTLFNKLSKLLEQSHRVGFTIILTSDRVQSNVLPKPIRSNLTTWLIHSLHPSDAKFLVLGGLAEKQNAGEFILKTPGLFCVDTGELNIKCSLPHIGYPEKDKKTGKVINEPLINSFVKKYKDKIEFNS